MKKVLDLEPNSTTVSRSVLDPLEAILVSRLVDEFVRFPALCPVRSPVCFLFSPFPATLENTSMALCCDCWRQPPSATPSTLSGGGTERCELIKDFADNMFDIVTVLVRRVIDLREQSRVLETLPENVHV